MSKTKGELILLSLQKTAYARVIIPENGGLTFPDLVILAKSYLGRKTNTLFNDPVWEDYTDEEILVEYYSYLMANNEDFRRNFEVESGLFADAEDDMHAWFDKQMEKTASEDKSDGFEYAP